MESYRNIAIILFSILTLVGFERIWRIWKRVDKRVDEEVAKHGATAGSLIDRINSEWGVLRASLESSHIIKAGAQPITFANTNYVNYWVTFDGPFPGVPVVLVTEAPGGEWCYVKVDEIEVGRFKFAIRTLSGVNIDQNRRIQWLAICPKPPLAPPGAVPNRRRAGDLSW